MEAMAWKKILPILLVLFALSALQISGFGDLLTLEFVEREQIRWEAFYQRNPLGALAAFSAVYILATSLALPGAAILTLAAGSFFGFWAGVPLVSLSSTVGATLSFLLSRSLMRDWVEKNFSRQSATVNRGIEREGGFYLFAIRLIPVFPFFLVNILMGLTRIKIAPFFFISAMGMLPGTLVYVNAGQQLSRIQSTDDILSPFLLLSLALLGILPWASKKTLERVRTKQCYRKFKKPSRFDYNMVVIGGGAAGLVTAYLGSSLKARIALIEKHKMGGDCLNTGCVPSKALLKSASLIAQAKQSQKFGIEKMDVTFEFSQIMERIKNIIKKIEPHDSIERYKKLNVDCFTGKAQILSPWEVQVNGKVLTTAHITIATGATPTIPPIPGIENADLVTSDTLWDLKTLPRRFLVLGAGAVGVEMAQAFCRLGSRVTMIQRSSHILSREDSDIAEELRRRMTEEGVEILTEHTPLRFDHNHLMVQNREGERSSLAFDKVLVASGRTPCVRGFGLERLGIRLRPDETIQTNSWLQTNFPNIWACGDVTGPFQLTHAASHQAWYCAVNALFGSWKKFNVDYSLVPRAIYTDPEIATVGKSETDCQREGTPYEITRYNLNDLDRAITDGEDRGFIKVLTHPKSDKIIGAAIAGPHAGEIILEFVTAMKHNFGLNAILGTIRPYPTFGEANKYLAGNWKKSHKPDKILSFIQKYHTWRRS